MKRVVSILCSFVVVSVAGFAMAGSSSRALHKDALREQSLIHIAQTLALEMVRNHEGEVATDARTTVISRSDDEPVEVGGALAAQVSDVFAGLTANGVPCFNCVNGAPANALGTVFPLATVPVGSPVEWQILYEAQVPAASTVVAAAFAIRASDNAVVFANAAQVNLPAGDLFVFTSFPNSVVPNLPGDAVLLALVLDSAGNVLGVRIEFTTVG